MLIEEILIVRHDGNFYGINTDAIEHILRVLDINTCTFSPKGVVGFCWVEGSILIVLDLSRLLFEKSNIDETADTALLISGSVHGMKYSVLLEEVINNIKINQKDVEYVA